VVDQFGRDPFVRAAALRTVTTHLNNADHTRDVYTWVVSHMVYIPDPDGAEFIQSPRVLLDTIQLKGRAFGDCDDHVVLLGSLLNSLGARSVVAGVKLFNSPLFNHVIILLPRPGQEPIVLDPCAKDAPPPKYGEFLVADGIPLQ
jgi:hypothetical protein